MAAPDSINRSRGAVLAVLRHEYDIGGREHLSLGPPYRHPAKIGIGLKPKSPSATTQPVFAIFMMEGCHR
jgi:hypothetical protein